MATDISDVNFNFRLVAASTTADYLTLDPDRDYTLWHTGFDVSEAAAETAIYFGAEAAPTASFAAGNKLVLTSGKTLTVPPKIRKLYYVTASGAPTFQVIANPRWSGLH